MRACACACADIEVTEIQQLLQSVYGEDEVPGFEVTAFIELFDADRDGKISWDEFAAALGAIDASQDVTSEGAMPLLVPSDDDGGDAPEPKISGTVTVQLDDGATHAAHAAHAAALPRTPPPCRARRRPAAHLPGNKDGGCGVDRRGRGGDGRRVVHGPAQGGGPVAAAGAG